MRLLACLLLLLSATAAAAQRRDREPVIDVHLHLYPDGPLSPAPPNLVTGAAPGLRSATEHMEATLAAMLRHNVVLGIVSNDNAPPGQLQRWADRGGRRIWASPYFEGTPGAPLPDVETLRREYRAGRLKAMGEIGAQYGGLALNDPRLEPYYALAEELDVPVGVHTGGGTPGTPYGCCPKFRMALGNPLALEDVLVRHPRLRVWIMHAGWPYRSEIIALMYQYPQVYADLAVIDWILPREEFHAYLRELVRAGLGDRLMFGSDQMLWPEAIGMAIEGVESADFLTPAQKRDILYNNAARFLRLDEKGGRP